MIILPRQSRDKHRAGTQQPYLPQVDTVPSPRAMSACDLLRERGVAKHAASLVRAQLISDELTRLPPSVKASAAIILAVSADGAHAVVHYIDVMPMYKHSRQQLNSGA
jgi:hypothetical protein